MSERRRPLVFATKRAAEQAHWMLPDRVLENVVVEAVMAGRVTGSRSRRLVCLDDRLTAVCLMDRTGRKRPRWVVVEVRETGAPERDDERAASTRTLQS